MRLKFFKYFTLGTIAVFLLASFPALAGATYVYIQGGTGTTTATAGQLLYSGAQAYQNVASSSYALSGTTLIKTGTFGALVGGTNSTIALNLTNPNTWTGLQQFNGNASTTQLTDSGNLYLTAITGTQCLHAVNGLVSGTGSDCGSGGGGSSYFSSSGGVTFANTDPLVGAQAFEATSTTATSTFAGSLYVGTSTSNVSLPSGSLFVPGIGHVGTSTCPASNTSVGGIGFEVCGDNNTNGGVNLVVGNIDAGQNAFSDVFMENDQTALNNLLYGVLDLNSTNYGLNGLYGYMASVPDGLQLITTEAGGMQIGASYAGGAATSTTILFYGGGNTANNEYGRFVANPNDIGGKFGLGSTSPTAQLSVLAGGLGVAQAASTILDIASDTPANAYTDLFNVQSSGNVGIGTSSPYSTLSVQGNTALEGAPTGTIIPFTVGSSATSSAYFQVVAVNAATAGNGLQLTPTAPGNGVTLTTTSANANDGLTIASKGANTLILNGGSTNGVNLQSGGANRLVVNTDVENYTPGSIGNSGTAITGRFTVNPVPSVGMPAYEPDYPFAVWNLGQVNARGSSPLNNINDFKIIPSIENYTAGSTTIANNTIASTTVFYVQSPITPGVNANITNAYGIFVGATSTFTTASTTNSIGLAINASSGALNNYAAEFLGGNVGIGTTSPATNLSNGGNEYVVGGLGVGSVNTTAGSVYATAGVTFTGLAAGAGNGAVCATTGGVLNYDAGANCIVSSERFKDDIATSSATTSLAVVLALNPVSFYYKSGYGDGGKSQWVGFIAEQALQVAKQVGVNPSTLVQFDASGTPYSFYYQNFTSYLTGAVQAVEGQVTAVITHQSVQDQEIAQLQAEVSALQNSQQVYICRLP